MNLNFFFRSPGQESQKIFKAANPMDSNQTKTKLLGYGFSILESVDPNPDNFVSAGIIHTRSAQIGCLLRLEPNLQAHVSFAQIKKRKKYGLFLNIFSFPDVPPDGPDEQGHGLPAHLFRAVRALLNKTGIRRLPPSPHTRRRSVRFFLKKYRRWGGTKCDASIMTKIEREGEGEENLYPVC